MRKLVFLPIVVASVLADFGAFGAATRGSRSAATKTNADENNAVMTTTPITARAAVRGTKAMSATQSVSQSAPTTARAAVRGAAATVSTPQPVQQTASVTARAAAKQKVINMGTKISSATANTVVSQECQDAYFGCMDSFCMLENVTGGRCKCSDKNAEYDGILADIMNLDQQSYIMQTEGVSLLRMGKSADEVYAMAEDAANKVSKDKKAEEVSKNKLDLSAWNNSWFDDAEDIWEDEDAIALESDLTSKTGDKLHAIAASTCTQQVPTQCKSSTPILRMIYVQKIQSDCAAYDNSLRQQQMESNQKLQTARQSLRDAALEEYQKANKYDLGGCVTAFNTCMQKEEVCGDGFLGCVTFAATDNLKNDKSGPAAEQTEIEFAHSKIKLAKTTMDELLSKRVFCDSVLEQCVNANVNDAVWTAFLKSAAPALKTAELDAEDKLRRNCVNEITQCYLTACKEQMDPNDEDGSYDMCLSNPDLFKSLCKVKLEPCLLATGGTYDTPGDSTLWDKLLARLSSLKVGACTTQIKECLLSEDVCGKDYAGCIGLSTYEIGRLCPVDKLTACAGGTEKTEEYVARVAQGIALGIDNSTQNACQSALNTAMLTYCGAETECPNAKVDESVFDGILQVRFCKTDADGKVASESDCYTDLTAVPDADLMSGKFGPVLFGKLDVSKIQYTLDNIGNQGNNLKFNVKPNFRSPFVIGTSSGSSYASTDITYSEKELNKLQTLLNRNYDTILDAIESDPKVAACMSGRQQIQGFSKDTSIGEGNARFPNLTANVRQIIAKAVIVDVPKLYLQKESEMRSGELATWTKTLKTNNDIAKTKAKQDGTNSAVCNSFIDTDGGDNLIPNYDETTGICTFTFQNKGTNKGVLFYQFPLITLENPYYRDAEAVRIYAYPNGGLHKLSKSTRDEYTKTYGQQ